LARAKIVMEPRVAVVHSHDNSMWYEVPSLLSRHAEHPQPVRHDVGTASSGRVHRFEGTPLDVSGALVRDDKELSAASKMWWMLKAVPFAYRADNSVQFLGPGVRSSEGIAGCGSYWTRVAGHHV
jgi:hypothetical protein